MCILLYFFLINEGVTLAINRKGKIEEDIQKLYIERIIKTYYPSPKPYGKSVRAYVKLSVSRCSTRGHFIQWYLIAVASFIQAEGV